MRAFNALQGLFLLSSILFKSKVEKPCGAQIDHCVALTHIIQQVGVRFITPQVLVILPLAATCPVILGHFKYTFAFLLLNSCFTCFSFSYV